MKLYQELYSSFQVKLQTFGTERMEQQVKKLRQIQQNLVATCDIKMHNVEKQTKAEKFKYHFSAPYNKNGVHYIAG